MHASACTSRCWQRLLLLRELALHSLARQVFKCIRDIFCRTRSRHPPTMGFFPNGNPNPNPFTSTPSPGSLFGAAAGFGAPRPPPPDASAGRQYCFGRPQALQPQPESYTPAVFHAISAPGATSIVITTAGSTLPATATQPQWSGLPCQSAMMSGISGRVSLPPPFPPPRVHPALRAPMPPVLAAAVSPLLALTCRQGHGLIRISGKPAHYGPCPTPSPTPFL